MEPEERRAFFHSAPPSDSTSWPRSEVQERSGRAAHGHYLLTLETVAAFVREEYWSGKTLEPQKAGVPPILSFFGSQRFGHVKSAQEAADVS